jgi:hypothetical protein
LPVSENRKPARMSIGRINSDLPIPKRGTASPENAMNPIADPERSAL